MPIKRIGIVVNTVGINGDIKIISRTDHPEERFLIGKEILIEDRPYKITKKYDKANTIILHLEGLDDVNDAVLLKTKEILQDVELEEGSFYYDDIIGFDVKNTSQISYGTIKDYQEMNNIIYFVVDKFLLPYIKPTFVEKIDFENKEIIITSLAEGIFQ